jgi:hypothetical protein
VRREETVLHKKLVKREKWKEKRKLVVQENPPKEKKNLLYKKMHPTQSLKDLKTVMNI